MKLLNRYVLSTALALSITAPVLAQGMKADDQIGFRKATYKFMELNMGRLKGNVEGTFDINTVKSAAMAINAAAQTKPELLFGEGSDKSAKYKVEARTEVWTENDKFVKAHDKLRSAAGALVVAVESGDKGKIKEAFGDVGKSCKACHDDFKAK